MYLWVYVYVYVYPCFYSCLINWSGFSPMLMQGWVDQFSTKLKSLFIQKSDKNLEITTSLY